MHKSETIFKYIFMISAVISILAILLISGFIFKEGMPFIFEEGIGKFIFGKLWAPGNENPSYGIFPMIVGTIQVTFYAMLLGVPIGVLSAIYLSKFCPQKIKLILMPAVSLMAGIPSIVYGFFALQLIVPAIRNIKGEGLSIAASSILLAIMILPTIISLSVAAIDAVPKSYYEGSIALGANDEESVFKVVVPAAKKGIISSIILALGRAIGETMAVLRVAGNQPRIPHSIFDGVRTMTTNIVIEMNYASGRHQEALIATGAVLFLFIIIINIAFIYIGRNKKR